MKHRFLALALSCSLLAPASTVYAAEMEAEKPVIVEYSEQGEDIHYLKEDLTRGSKKPGANASVHDLSLSNYNYHLTNFGYQLFTGKWLTSDSGEISVSLSDFKTIEEYGGTKNKITFKLCDSSGVLFRVKKQSETVQPV